MRKKSIVTGLITVALAFVLFIPSNAPAFACTPPPGGLPKYTVADRVQAASIVLQGVATSITGSPQGQEVATVQVQRYFKGVGPATVKISGLGADAACLSPVDVGDHLIFYTQGDPNAGLRAYYLSQFDAIAPADSNTIAQMEAVTGQGQAPSRPGGAEASTNDVGTAAFGGAAIGFLAGAFAGAIAVFLLRKHSP